PGGGLCDERGDHGSAVTAQRGERFEVGLDTGSAAGVSAGNRQDGGNQLDVPPLVLPRSGSRVSSQPPWGWHPASTAKASNTRKPPLLPDLWRKGTAGVERTGGQATARPCRSSADALLGQRRRRALRGP